MQQEPTIPQPAPPVNQNRPASPVTPPPSYRQKRKKEGWKSALSTIAIFIIAPLIALFLTAFVFQSYEVDGPSMETTLQNRDRLIVWKIPRTFSRVTGNPYIPPRGEIIVFVKRGITDTFQGSVEKQLIKRVIGLPGERVVVYDGSITVYNKEHPEGFNPDRDGGYEIAETNTGGNIDITVPDGEVFVAGDNRGNSLDSRAFGTISSKDIVGDLAFRIFPLNKAQAF